MMKKESSKATRTKGIGTIPNTLSYILILILLLVFIYLLWPTKVLRASNFKTGEELKQWKVGDGDIFSIEYIHSVEQSPVIENFLIDNKDIILQDTYFHSYGAGLPATTPYKTELTENGIRVYDINLKIEDLIYRTSSQGREHKVIVGNKDYMFLDFSSHRTGVRFELENMTRLKYLIKEVDLLWKRRFV